MPLSPAKLRAPPSRVDYESRLDDKVEVRGAHIQPPHVARLPKRPHRRWLQHMHSLVSGGLEQIRVEDAAIRHNGGRTSGQLESLAIPAPLDGNTLPVDGPVQQALKADECQLLSHSRAQ